MSKPSISIFAAVALAAVSIFASAQDTKVSVPRYVTLPSKPAPAGAPAATLQTWNGTFTSNGQTNHFTMVGTDPSSTNTTTNVQFFIIPLRMGYNINGTKTIFDPTKKLSTGSSVTAMVNKSPILKSLDWTQGGTDLGATQYLDAYQRGNFWTNVMTNANYHVKLSPVTILPSSTLVVPASKGTVTTEFGITVGTADINWFDTQINNIITQNSQITPASVVLFLTYDVYLTEGTCCIGGYHSATGNQTYMHATYIDHTGIFSQDISALSHEVGEWYDDPLVNNTQGACGGILENGDPLEGLANFGTFPVTLNGVTWHPQDLVFLKYFGQTPSTSVNNWWTFNNSPSVTRVCEFGQ
jgi:hypothetical protein